MQFYKLPRNSKSHEDTRVISEIAQPNDRLSVYEAYKQIKGQQLERI